MKDFDPSKTPYDCEYIKCKTERELLARFLVLWNSEEFSPDIITGWYIEGYDVPYLINRITNVLGPDAALRLSPHGVINSREVFVQGQKKIMWTILGVAVLDYIQLYTKFIIPNKGQPESKSLNYICELELGEKKLDYSEYGDLDALYTGQFDVPADEKVEIGSVRHKGRLRSKLKTLISEKRPASSVKP
jgi:DNA polymerase elongation subunit (family B)